MVQISMDLETFLNNFKDEISRQHYMSGLHKLFETLYPVLNSRNGRYMLCFGCGDLVPSQGIKSRRTYQFKGKWHCGNDANPLPGILTSMKDVKEFAERMGEVEPEPQDSFEFPPIVYEDDSAMQNELDEGNHDLLQQILADMEDNGQKTSIRVTSGQET